MSRSQSKVRMRRLLGMAAALLAFVGHDARAKLAVSGTTIVTHASGKRGVPPDRANRPEGDFSTPRLRLKAQAEIAPSVRLYLKCLRDQQADGERALTFFSPSVEARGVDPDGKIRRNTTNATVPAPERFNPGRYRKGVARSVRFDRPGLIKLLCEIHPRMIGYILVPDTPGIGTASPKCDFIVPRVPPDACEVLIRHGRLKGPVTLMTCDVAAEEEQRLDVAVPAGP